MANLRVVISALNKASGDLAKVKGDIKDVGDAGKDAKGGVTGFADGIGSILGKAALVAGSVAAVATALREVYDLAKEGAELEYARTRFDNLAASIGTVSDALLSDLKDATGGMMSDAELVAGAADFMALGLAKSHDEVVRLTDVAGALGMNMNQLVLTLTNQTTMRFDALGVSVDGFQEKVKALEAAGLSANDAFKEAFLQQAEEQILKVGSAADSSIGAFQRMEAAQANYFNGLKQDLVEAGTWWAQFWEGVYNAKITERAYEALINQADALGIDTRALRLAVEGQAAFTKEVRKGVFVQDDSVKATAAGIAANQAAVDAMGEQVKYQTEMNIMRSRGTNANYDYSASEKVVAESIAYVRSELQQQADNITTLDTNYKGIINLGYKYTDILGEIEDNQVKIRELQANGSKESLAEADALIAKNEELKGSMTDLANQVTLDMFQATIAIGGVTEAELAAYMQMAIDMGLMSEEGAQAAITAYNNAIETINGYEIDEKTGNVSIDAVAAFVTLDLLQQYQLLDKEQRVFVKTYYGTSGGYDPYENYTGPGTAVGGSVNAGNPYTWQEYGYRGEVFVPSADGFVLSRADAERALARALYGGGSAISPEEIGKAVAQAMSGITSSKKGGNVYNLTMPTSSNPADVRTAFELMEAWGA
jgi:hypothetical protein